MTEHQHGGGLDEVLNHAVDRQIAEQRALRQSLDDLRTAVRELADRPAARVDLTKLEERIDEALTTLTERVGHPPAVDLSGIEDQLRRATPDMSGLEERLRDSLHGTVLGATESTVASISDQLRSLREAVVPRLEHAAEAGMSVQTIGQDIAAVREAVSSVSGDLEGIAQALIEFNSGLRGWASTLDETVGSIKLTVGELYALSTQPASKSTRKDDDDDASATTRERPGTIEERIQETAELSEYLADQIEDLDGVMGRLTELPVQLEGVVSQALKRTLTARAKLDREAETALDEVLGSLDEHVEQLSAVLERFEQEEDHVRKIALEQVELSSRIESLQSTFVDRIDRIETERRRGEEAIAVAIDRSARGLAPKALESLSKATRRKKSATPKKAKAAKEKPAAGSTQKKKPARKKPTAKRAARKASSRQDRRQDWTPLPDDIDDARA